MNLRKPKKKPAFDLEAFFERVAAKVDSEAEEILDFTREPWPDWQTKLIGIMARSYAPELTAQDWKERPWCFEGYGLAGMFFILKWAESLKSHSFSDADMLTGIEKMHEGQGILEIVPPEGLLAFAKESLSQTSEDLEPFYAKIAEAARQPIKDAVDFFEAFGDGLKRRTGFNAIKRLQDNNTVKICLFVMSMRALIEAGVFLTVSELIGYYHFQLDRKGETFSVSQENSRAAFDKQFRRICSKAGLKLAGRGRPRGGSF